MREHVHAKLKKLRKQMSPGKGEARAAQACQSACAESVAVRSKAKSRQIKGFHCNSRVGSNSQTGGEPLSRNY